MTPEQQLAQFIGRFSPEMAKLIRTARRRLRSLLPWACELVYDNYNFLVIGYGASEKASEAVVSLAAYARGLNLFFLNGAALSDPERRLGGTGKRVRHIRVASAATLDEPAVRALLRAAAARVDIAVRRAGGRRLLIKSVSAKQRPRRTLHSRPARRERNR